MKIIYDKIRYIIVIGNLLLSLLLYSLASKNLSSNVLFGLRITQIYGFLAIGFLYLSLLPSPLYSIFPKLPGHIFAGKARRALGVSAFYYAFLHSYLNFFNSNQGFNGWPFLSFRYKFLLLLGIIPLIILGVLTLTSTDSMVLALGKYWKKIQILVYPAGILTLFHVIALGSNFTNISNPIPAFVILCLFFLIALETIRIYKFIIRNYSYTHYAGFVFFIILITFGIIIFDVLMSSKLNIQVRNELKQSIKVP